jgi:GNAT superfamily N-acetyltransferase
MSRQPVSMRQATIGDVPFLVELWGDMLRRADRQEQVHDVELIVKEAAASSERRLLVADYDGEPAGAVLLRVTPMTPLNLEPVVQALAPHVTPSFRGKGIGSALMEAAVVWAEDLGIGHITTAAPASSRNGNRFMARLSLRPQAVLRASSTYAVRTKLASLQPTSARISDRAAGRRQLMQVLAARRQLSRRTTGESTRS